MRFLIGVFVFVLPIDCFGQAKIPHVNEIIKQFDADGDGFISKQEISSSRRYVSQFPRWDADQNGKVSADEIIKMRARFGIAADGNRNSDPRASMNRSVNKPFTIPEVKDLVRVDRNTRPSRAQAANSEYIFKTRPHPVAGERYAILTDHQEDAYLEPLKRLAKHRNAKIYRCKDFGEFRSDGKFADEIAQQLVAEKPKFVAIAPRLDSFSENTILSMWELLSTLDDDPQIDCFPGYLVASNPKSFAKLIDQSIAHQPLPPTELKPIAISQVQNARETRSLQKAGILRKQFKKAGIDTPVVAIYGQSANAAPRLDGEQVWNLKVEGRRKFIKQFPAEAQSAMADSNLIIMHGHGIPGMSCSVDVDGIPDDLTGKLLLSGSCFSASPVRSDLPRMGQAPGGYEVEQRDAFAVRAIDKGALVAFGHQRLSSGFPHLYPVLENWVDGQTVGNAYQQLLNALIESTNTKSGQFVISEAQKKQKRLKQNSLLYVVIGDPALQPFQPHPSLASD